jgi:uncharacterized protein YjiS (DUF1127 family)
MVALSRRLFVPVAGLRTWPRRALTLLFEWQERARTRAMLAELDDHLLRDLGIDRAAARRESDKPFWRA